GQAWMWTDGSFQSPASYQYQFPGSPKPDNPRCVLPTTRVPITQQRLDNSCTSPFRIRKVAFTPGETQDGVKAVAVTAGCCLRHKTSTPVDPNDPTLNTGSSVVDGNDPTVNFPRLMKYSRFVNGSTKWSVMGIRNTKPD